MPACASHLPPALPHQVTRMDAVQGGKGGPQQGASDTAGALAPGRVRGLAALANTPRSVATACGAQPRALTACCVGTACTVLLPVLPPTTAGQPVHNRRVTGSAALWLAATPGDPPRCGSMLLA